MEGHKQIEQRLDDLWDLFMEDLLNKYKHRPNSEYDRKKIKEGNPMLLIGRGAIKNTRRLGVIDRVYDSSYGLPRRASVRTIEGVYDRSVTTLVLAKRTARLVNAIAKRRGILRKKPYFASVPAMCSITRIW